MKKPVVLFLILTIFMGIEAFSQHSLPLPKNGKTYVIAHRGAHIGIPENSLAAYQKAIDLGCDFVEIDVRTTKDGAIVSIHNTTIDQYVAGKTGIVSEMTLAELKALDIGEKIGNEWKNTRIPTFEEILKLCHGKIGIYLDLKAADPATLIATIRKYKMEQQIVWYISAANTKAITSVKQNCPECLVMPDPGPEQNIDKVISTFQSKVLASDMGHLTKSFVEKAHKNHALVFVDESKDDLDKLKVEWKKIIDWKTDGIQTDQPEMLIRFLETGN